MRAQIKKEMLEAAFPVALVFVGLCAAWLLTQQLEDVLIAPLAGRCVAVVSTAIAAGALIGFVQFAAERWRGTLGSAVHRCGGHSRLFAAKMVVGIVATLLLAVGPVFVFALWHLALSVNQRLMQSDRLVEYAIYGLSGASGYALGVLAAQYRRGWWLDLTLLVSGTCTVFGVTTLTIWFAGDSIALALLVYLLVQGAMAASLSVLAFKLMRGARDRNLLLPRGQFIAVTGFGLVLFVLPVTNLVSGVSASARRAMLTNYPVIAQDLATGEFKMMDRDSRELSMFDVGSGAQRLAGREPSARLVYWPLSRLREPRNFERDEPQFRRAPHASALLPQWESLPSWRGPSDYNVHGLWFSALGYFDRSSGVVRVYWLWRPEASLANATRIDAMPPSLPMHRTFVKTDGRGRFSPSTMLMSLDRLDWFLLDLEDHTLWKVSPTSFDDVVSELHLPDGDHLVRVEPFYSRSSLRMGTYTSYDALLFVGEKDKYVWRDRAFVRYTGELTPESIRDVAPEEALPPSAAEGAMILRLRQTDTDAIHPRIEVLHAGGEKVLFAHEYSPATATSRCIAAMLYAGAVLRMPSACVYSFMRDSDERDDKLVIGGIDGQVEPLLVRSRRPWLLLANFAVVALCCASLVKRMKRQGVDRTTIVSCTVIVALFGVIAYVYFRGLMPKRASLATPTSGPAAARELLIQSA